MPSDTPRERARKAAAHFRSLVADSQWAGCEASMLNDAVAEFCAIADAPEAQPCDHRETARDAYAEMRMLSKDYGAIQPPNDPAYVQHLEKRDDVAAAALASIRDTPCAAEATRRALAERAAALTGDNGCFCVAPCEECDAVRLVLRDLAACADGAGRAARTPPRDSDTPEGVTGQKTNPEQS